MLQGQPKKRKKNLLFVMIIEVIIGEKSPKHQ